MIFENRCFAKIVHNFVIVVFVAHTPNLTFVRGHFERECVTLQTPVQRAYAAMAKVGGAPNPFESFT